MTCAVAVCVLRHTHKDTFGLNLLYICLSVCLSFYLSQRHLAEGRDDQRQLFA